MAQDGEKGGTVGTKRGCQHLKFEARVDVGRLSEKDNDPVTVYTADVRIKCAECGLPFRFIGAPFGYSQTQPMLSADGLELRAPLEPAHVPELLGHPKVSGRA